MLRRTVIIILLAIDSFCLLAQSSHTDSIKSITDSLAVEKRLPTANDGKYSSKNAVLLSKIASKGELLQLTRHSSPIVRVYAIYYLTQLYQDLPFLDLIREHLNDIETVQSMSWQYPSDGGPYATYNSEMVGDLFIRFIGGGNYPELMGRSIKYKPYIRDKKTSERIDSLIICSDSKLKTKEGILFQGDTIECCYSCVREQVIEKKNPLAVLFLARYRRKQDIDLLLDNFPPNNYKNMNLRFYVFEQIQAPKMFKCLSDSVNKYHDNDSYLSTVALYRDTAAYLLLRKAYSLSDTVRTKINQDFANVLKSRFTPIYAPLLFEALEASPGIYPNVPAALWEIDSVRTYNYLLKCIYSSPADGKWGSYWRGNTFGMVFEIIVKNKPSYIDYYLIHNLQPGLLNMYFVNCMKYIYRRKKDEYVTPMLDLIRVETNKDNRDVEIEILRSYNSIVVNNALDKLFNERPELKPLHDNDKRVSEIMKYIQ